MKRILQLVLIGALFAGGFLIFRLFNQGPSATVRPAQVDFALLQEKKDIIPIAVIGSGPAGLAAGLYGARQGIYTVVFQGSQPGGQLTTTSYVENWPGIPKMLGSRIMTNAQKQAEQSGAVMVADGIERVDMSGWPFKLWTQEGKEITALSVVIATGSNSRLLAIPGEKEYWGKGVTTCAICDAPYYKEKNVVVIGGGDSALEEASLLASFAKEVTMLVRSDKLRATVSMQQRLTQHSNIKVIYNTQVTKIIGNDKLVTAVELYNVQDKTTKEMPIDGVFLAIGHIPNTQIFKDYLTIDEQGYIQLPNRTQETTIQGVFAAGDVADPDFKQAGAAAGDGVKAGIGAVNFLRSHGFDGFATKLEKNFFELESDQPKVELQSLKSAKELDEALKKDALVVLDFYAPWCPSCMHMLPVVEAIAGQLAGKVVFYKVNTGESIEIADKFKVTNVPWLLVLEKGKEIARSNAIFTKRQLYNYLSPFVFAHAETDNAQ